MKAGELLMLENGEYSDRSWDGPFKVLRDFSIHEQAAEFKTNFKPKYEGQSASPYGFVAWLTTQAGLLEPLDIRTIHVGCYGEIEIDENDDPPETPK